MVPENVPTAEQLWHEWVYEGVNAQTAIHYAYDRLAPYFRQPASVDPAPPVSTGIATAETLEQLAEMLDEEWQRKYGLPSFRAYAGYATEFILRAAKPVIDVTVDEFRAKQFELCNRDISANQDRRDLMDWLNSRIRYKFALPEAECKDIKASRDYYERQYTLAKNALNDIRAALAKALEGEE